MGFSLKKLIKQPGKALGAVFPVNKLGTYAMDNYMGTDLFGGGGQSSEEAFAREQFQFQKDLAANGIRMKVADARAAGLSPLAALGAQTFNPSPVSFTDAQEPGLADRLGEIGMGMATQKMMGPTEEERKLDTAYKIEQVRGLKLQNDGLDPSIPKPTAPTLPSPMSNEAWLGQGDAYKVRPAEITASTAGRPWEEAGAINDIGWSRTSTGLTKEYSTDMKARTEDDLPAQAKWHGRNQAPFTGGDKPDLWRLRQFGYDPKKDDWSWNVLKQEWQPARGKVGRHPYDSRWNWRTEILEGVKRDMKRGGKK